MGFDDMTDTQEAQIEKAGYLEQIRSLEAEQLESVEEYEPLKAAYRDSRVALNNNKNEIESTSVRPSKCLLNLDCTYQGHWRKDAN